MVRGHGLGRWVALTVAVICIAAMTAACGKRGNLTRPEPATYPRQYPPQ